ncbi:STM3941 family protein [Flavobacterium tistrianum]|uniref:STM3941 family protein n=1 Tax=Flavobacterium tistrianum TaxID=1685414 RepID=UPI0013A675E2|nr:STM3941 family protein [Flavobacterium tistrianum]KAF2341662.1 hypothetical protein DMB71_07235 [Flavobacterium tistrianum]
MALAFVASAIFVALGIQFILNSQQYISPVCRSVELIKITGFASLSFCGMCLIYIFFKIFDTKPGLIINDKGINDNSHYCSVGLIAWSEIKDIRTRQIKSTKFLLIDVSNPKEFIEKSSRLKGFLMKANLRIYGTPLSITSNSLNYNFEDLEKLLHKEWKKHKSR